MSNLSDYTRGLDDAVWTDALAVKLDTAPSTTTFTDTRAGYLDLLAGGVGSKPVQSYAYKGNTVRQVVNNITVSITDYVNTLTYSHAEFFFNEDGYARSYAATSNTNVRMVSQMSDGRAPHTEYAFVVTRFG